MDSFGKNGSTSPRIEGLGNWAEKNRALTEAAKVLSRAGTAGDEFLVALQGVATAAGVGERQFNNFLIRHMARQRR